VVEIVLKVPDTSRVAALELAQQLSIPYREGFVKNRYVGRTFIMPGQQMRTKKVRKKLNAMALEFSGKNVLIVDGQCRHRLPPYCFPNIDRFRFHRARDHIPRDSTDG
jgi:glutamine phosphoribosylpyrophosphate amidotransferase